MTPTLERDIAEYLWHEAVGVVVRDTLDDIEHGITVLPFGSPRQRPSRLLPFVGAAASIAVVAGLAFANHEPAQQPAAAAPQPGAVDATIPTVPSAPPATTVVPTTVAEVRLPLPGGALLQGVEPSCTTLDSIVYDCTITAYPEPAEIDMTGYAAIIVDDTSHVSGGCRARSADALQWMCYVGQRAVDEQIVGPNFIGDWAPRTFIAG
jgi:hypothetical protein